MLTIIETPLFKRDADALWSEDERGEFCAWLSGRPDIGDVIKGSGAAEKCGGHVREQESAAVSV